MKIRYAIQAEIVNEENGVIETQWAPFQPEDEESLRRALADIALAVEWRLGKLGA